MVGAPYRKALSKAGRSLIRSKNRTWASSQAWMKNWPQKLASKTGPGAARANRPVRIVPCVSSRAYRPGRIVPGVSSRANRPVRIGSREKCPKAKVGLIRIPVSV